MKNVMIELQPTPTLVALTFDPSSVAETVEMATPNLPGIQIDPTFAPVQLPRLVAATPRAFSSFDTEESFSLDLEPVTTTYLVRGTMSENEADYKAALKDPNVVGIYADPKIEVCGVCPGSPPVGTDADVARVVGVPQLAARGMNGRGVLVAIVDTGINMAYLRAHGKNPGFDAARSWRPPSSAVTPGAAPVNHGTMCAYDVTIAAPQCTLLDVALLLSSRSGGSVMEGLLSDAVLAYRHLMNVLLAPQRPGEARTLVVSNSWGMFHPDWDFPRGDGRNYSHNPAHPFNVIVASLERAGADILFAAGNCGRDCADGRCRGNVTGGIYGANSHDKVLSVAGADVTKVRAGYSTQGPGCLTRIKPDIASYTHFRCSGVYAADGGTSAATPVAAGVVAAFRSRFPLNRGDARTFPAQIRNLVRRTAEDRGAIGFDFDYGWGIISGQRLAAITSLSVTEPVTVAAVSDEELGEYDLAQRGIFAPEAAEQDTTAASLGAAS